MCASSVVGQHCVMKEVCTDTQFVVGRGIYHNSTWCKRREIDRGERSHNIYESQRTHDSYHPIYISRTSVHGCSGRVPDAHMRSTRTEKTHALELAMSMMTYEMRTRDVRPTVVEDMRPIKVALCSMQSRYPNTET